MRSLSKLQRYIQSLGTEVPEVVNIDECVFCGESHASLGVYEYSPITGNRTLVRNTYCCSTCAAEIDDMAYSQYRDADMHSITNSRMQLFKNYLAFEDDVANHIVHYSSKIDAFVANGYRNTCYFCKSNIGNTNNPKRIPVPVQFSTYINGGHVRVCKKCYDEASPSLFNLYEQHAHPQICPGCNRTYHLTSQEFNFRLGGETLGKHLCPECVYTEIGRMLPKDIRYINANALVRTEGIERFSCLPCKECGKAFDVDITLNLSTIESRHKKRGLQFLCSNCSESMIQTFIYNYGENIRITLFITDKHAKYVIKLTGAADDILKSPDYDKKTDIAELLFIAIESADEFLTTRQLALPFEEVNND